METEKYLYEKVLSKVHYDQEKQEYIIKLTDYTYLNLSNEQFRKLKRICRLKGIKLEYKNDKVPIIEDLELFKQYNDIKQKISLDPTNQELEQIRIEIRNKIANQNFKAIRILLNRIITGLPQMKDKEDIYQIGYTTLLEFIDSYDILKKEIFTIAIKKYLVHHISRKIIAEQKNITNYANTCMQLLLSSIENLEHKNISIEELSKELNIPEYQIKNLLNLENILTPLSIDEEISLLTEKNEKDNSPLFNDTFENDIIDRLSSENILKILKTLPKQQMEVLMLYYGFIDGHCYNIIELANKYGITKARINEIKLEGLKNLRLSIRAKYISNLYETDDLSYDVTIPKTIELKNLETELIGLIPPEELIEYTKILSPIKKDIIYLIYGLKDGICYNLKTTSEILGISPTKGHILKESALKLIKYQILKKYYHIQEPTIVSDEQYLDYLMKIYLSKPITKTKNK